jgi:hypothetical protein
VKEGAMRLMLAIWLFVLGGGLAYFLAVGSSHA